MNDTKFEKLAGQLARCAVTRDTTELGHIKQAADFKLDDIVKYVNTPTGRYLAGGLGGAGLGALVGAAQPKRKGRNALYYGALGGLGGLGLAHVYNNAGAKTPADDKTPDTPAKPEAAESAPPTASTEPLVDGPTLRAELAKPTTANSEAPPPTGQVAIDAPAQLGRAAQQLPGMEGVSPLAQAGGGAVGLYAGVRGSRPLPGLFARSAARRNDAALADANTAINSNRDWIVAHNRQATAQARALGQQDIAAARQRAQEAADTLRSLGANRAQVRAAYSAQLSRGTDQAARRLAAAQAAAAQEFAAATAANTARLNRVNASNASRSFRGRVIPQLIRILSMAGGAYGGATAPNWVPDTYNAVNDQYNAARRQ